MTVNKQPSLFKKFADKFNFADEKKLIDTLKATAFKVKDGEVTDEQMMALLIVADQYGLNPFTKEIFAYPDKQNGIVPVVSVDGWSRIINQHPDMDGLEFVYDDNWINDLPGAKPCPASIECVIYRKGRTHPVRIKEFLDEVYRPEFEGINKSTGKPYKISGPWQSHTKRLMRHKSLIQCSRIAFGFTGIYDQDEADRIIEGQAVVVDDPSVVSEASDAAKQMLPKLVNRATKEKSWQAALEYAGEKFSGFDAIFLKNEINKAKALAESALLPSSENSSPAKETASMPIPENSAPENPSGSVNNKPHRAHLAEARGNLG
jgi:phage recombination protein Bet